MLIAAVVVLGGSAGVRADDPLATPGSVGFSADGLKTFQQAMRALVGEATLAGLTTLVARHGKVVGAPALAAVGVLGPGRSEEVT